MIIHPCLFLNAHRIEVARANIARHEWAARIYQQLKLEADKLEKTKLPEFETAWWQQAKTKRWQDVYPEVEHHTYFVPRGAAQKAWESALVYALGGDGKYAEQAKRVLLHYTSYSFEVRHPDVGMNVTGWGMHLLYAYDALYEHFAPDERAKLDDFFDRMVAAVATCDEFWIEHNPGGRYNNHFAWHKLMMATYGLFYGKDEWVERAIESNQGIRELIEHGFMDDGIWFESSLNYHFAALYGLYQTAEIMRTAGHPLDLYTHRFTGGRTLEDGFSGIVQEAFPDTTLPGIGDTYGHVSRLADNPAYEYAWNAYRKPLYAWLLSRKRTPLTAISLFREDEPGRGEPPPVFSRTFPEHGHVILRSSEGRRYWGSDSWVAFLSRDLDSIHSNRDKLSLLLCGREKLLAPDCNAQSSAEPAFSSDIQRELNRSTVCHNTLMVDRHDHQPIGEKLSLLDFERSKQVKSATIADLKGLVYPGVKLQRTVTVTKDYVLDVFQAVSDEEHDYEWLFHAIDEGGQTRIKGEFLPVSLPRGAPWKWLKNARSARIDGDWQAEWRQGELRFCLTMLGVSGTEVTLCDFPRNDRLDTPPVPMLMVRRKGKSAIFVALYQAEPRDLPAIRVSASSGQGDLMLRVEVNGTESEHRIRRLAR